MIGLYLRANTHTLVAWLHLSLGLACGCVKTVLDWHQIKTNMDIIQSCHGWKTRLEAKKHRSWRKKGQSNTMIL